jgi:flagellar biosynthesis/type III secretory pathway M-ring protein FliF/YscJ
LLVALSVFGLGTLTEAIVRQNSAGSSWWNVFDQALVALVAAAIVYGYERQRRRAAEERLKLVREMAEQIDEAAHIIDYFVHHTGTTDLDRNVANSLERIHWALRELVPGRSDDFLHSAELPQTEPAPPPSHHAVSPGSR